MDRMLLQTKMREKKFTADDLAEKIGVSRATFFRKLKSNGESFTISEVESLCKALGLSRSDVHDIFFKR